ncbi:hypothetical protein [Rosistilla oblonga]
MTKPPRVSVWFYWQPDANAWRLIHLDRGNLIVFASLAANLQSARD